MRFRRAAVNPDGSVVWFDRRRWSHNLILDSGLNEVAARTWAQCFTQSAVGTGTNPFERDSGATTFTATAGAVSASAGFFQAGDVGRLLRLDSGEQGYITAFTDTQNVTWNGPDAAASVGTIHYVNRTALQTETKRTASYRTASGDNGSTWNAVNGEWTHQRTFLFSAEAGAVTYREIGWSWGPSPTQLFGGAILPGGGDSLVAGQQYLVQMQLIVRYSPTSSATAPDVGSGGWNTEGDIALGDVRAGADGGGGYPIAEVNSAGNPSGGNALEPSAFGVPCYRYTSAVVLPTATNASVSTPSGSNLGNLTLAGYVSGSFSRTGSITVGVSSANGNWFGVGIARSDAGGAPYSCVLAVKFDATQVKVNTHTLTIRFRFTWGRRFS